MSNVREEAQASSGPVLIAGGYGVVGLQLAALIRKRAPDLPLLLAGRTQSAADDAAAQLGNARGLVMDITTDDPLTSLETPVSAVVAAVNDPGNTLLKAAIKRAIPYVDITRWTERLMEAEALVRSLQPRSSVTLASSWMAGLSAILARRTCQDAGEVDTIDTKILYRLADKAGPNSVEYADRLAVPFRIWQQGQWRKARPVTDPVLTHFPSGDIARTYRFDEPSQETLVEATGARSISSRIGYDDASAMRSLVFMVRSGLWRLISGDMFTRFRHALIYHPGEGAAHEIVIDVTGSAGSWRSTLFNPQGQTHLTALGAYIQLCETVGLEGRIARAAGIHFPEQATDFDFAHRILTEEGVTVEIAHPA